MPAGCRAGYGSAPAPEASLDRARVRTILSLSLPIIGGMVSQNVLNLVDTAMVGSLGDAALAAVGIGSFANFVAIAFITGMSTGVQAMAARRKGEGRDDETAVPLNGGLLVAVALAVVWSAALWLATPELFPFLHDDPAVLEVGVPYLRVRLLAMVGVGMNFAFRGYWNGVSRSRLYLSTIVIMHVVNIVGNWVFIWGNLGAPEMGAVGAGLASTLAVYVGTLVYVLLGLRFALKAGFLRGLPDLATVRTMLRLAVPAGISQEFLAAGYLTLFWIIGRVGTAELAAGNVLQTITMVAILPGLGFGLGANSLVSQALGRGDPADARRWGWDVVRVAAVVMGALGLPMLLVPDLVLGVFLHDPDTLALARLPLRITGGTIVLDAVGMVLLNALFGAGAARTVMAVGVSCQWLLGLPLAYLVGPVLGYGLAAIWGAQILYRGLQASVFAVIWQRGSWASIRV
jgi:MATE family multidrug resistance protein